VKNVDQVALEAGNSPEIIFEHYRELVTPKQANAWFAITPKSVAVHKATTEKERKAKTISFQTAKAAA
jgi:hypothetical protein